MKKIFLIGLMGSGKTYWAEKLKRKLKVAAYDLDNLVEIMEERTIEEIFTEEGEEYFRTEEARMLRLFKEKKEFILACGGGTPCFHDNMTWMNKTGITIWINEPVSVLAERLKTTKEHRPLISSLHDDELVPFLEKMLTQREVFYAKAAYQLGKEEITEQSFTKILKEHA
ncbi:shikimate kinase [Segetibacter sp. 3557_3]|uniref:shikimate kinase n=1 Tax=Segetibacter sp. 3557_3 TaxID=2547429 RepID=UPI001058ADE8|nr:shikimate kinase [Segetibacter sp. 3557_3]TDH25679.1 shikimate kinase [Segetibacter sp. 3557_3]